MIRVNLLGEKVDKSREIALNFLSFAGGLLGVLVLCVVVQTNANRRLQALKSEEQTLNAELTEIKKVTKQVQDLENKKRVLREKIMTIANLNARKRGPVRVVDDLNLAIPERAWLTSIKEKLGSLEINGVALDNQTIAAFMQKLGESKYFGNIELVQSSQQIVNEVKLKQFSLMAELKNPFVVEIPKDGKADGKQPNSPKAKTAAKEA